MAGEDALQFTLTISVLATLLGTMGFSLAFKDYTASLMAGIIFKRARRIKPGTRVKVLTSPIIKGDIETIGWLRTTLKEVGDGERLPSVQTGRIMKIPNFLLFNNPTLIYGDQIIDEVVAYVTNKGGHYNEKLLENMRHAIVSEGHKVIDIGLYQKETCLVVHGIYESNMHDLADSRSRILSRYLDMIDDISVARETPKAAELDPGLHRGPLD